MVETTTNDLGGVLTADTVQNLPVNGRDYTKLIYLNPGVAGSPDQISDSPGSFGEFSHERRARPLQQLSARRNRHE